MHGGWQKTMGLMETGAWSLLTMGACLSSREDRVVL